MASAVVSALLGWYLAPIYVSWRKVAAILFVPFAILASAALTAGALYVLTSPILLGAPFGSFVSAQKHYIPDYAFWYVAAGSPVWFPGFIAATIFLTRATVRG
jgi:hypothetical protein